MANETSGGAGWGWDSLVEFLRRLKEAVGVASADLEEVYRLVVEYPLDDQPRVVYAALARRLGDRPRSEFIELQLQYARLSEGSRAAEAYSLGSRARQLQAIHHRRWAAPVRDLVRTYEFNRGFVELVSLRASDFLDNAERIMRSAPILHLDLTDAGGFVAALADSLYLRRIRSLSLNSGKVNDTDLQDLAKSENLSELRWLSLANNSITSQGLRTALSQPTFLARLPYVNLMGNPFDPQERYAHDLGMILETWLPPEGDELEREYGPHIPWLHLTAPTVSELQPDRFRMAGIFMKTAPAGELHGEGLVP